MVLMIVRNRRCYKTAPPAVSKDRTAFRQLQSKQTRVASSSHSSKMHAALNPEPADPKDRKAHHLPPKSYADAAEEALHANNHGHSQGLEYTTYIDEDSIKETPPNTRHERSERRSLSEPRAFGEVLDEQENNQHYDPATPTRMPRKPVAAPPPVPPAHAPPPAPGKSYADAAHEHLDDSHPNFNVAGDDAQELHGEGIDASPRSPIRRAHKRAPSKGLNGDGKEHHEQTPNKEAKLSHDQRQHNSPSEAHWLGQSKDHKASRYRFQDHYTQSKASGIETPESPKGSQHQDQDQNQNQKQDTKSNKEMDEKSQDKGDKKVNEQGQGKIVYERFGNGDGETLTSVKPFENFEKALRQDKIEESQNRKEEFASGRQAGAGWSTSACVSMLDGIVTRTDKQTVSGGHLSMFLCNAVSLPLWSWPIRFL